jgi:hypothetical protein
MLSFLLLLFWFILVLEVFGRKKPVQRGLGMANAHQKGKSIDTCLLASLFLQMITTMDSP